MKSIDLLILDDEKDIAVGIGDIAEMLGLKYIAFSSGLEALNYVKQNAPDNLPRGYLLDMRIPGSEANLQSPLDIYNFLKDLNATEYFRFYTGHFSEHDEKVAGITGAQVIIKPGADKIVKFLKELKVRKPQR